MITSQNIYDAALACRAAGLGVIPNHPELKHPVGYTGWQTRTFTEAELKERILTDGWNMGIRNEEGLDFDNFGNPDAITLSREWAELVEKQVPGLTKRLLLEKTQSGGFHIVWKCSLKEGNSKIAERPATEDELKANPLEKKKTLIETRGEGGQFVVAPSRGYTLVHGDWCNLPVITPEERSILLDCAKLFNKVPQKTISRDIKAKSTLDVRPGDIFNEQGAEEAFELLLNAGWTLSFEKGDARYLTRPGKEKGVSATFGYVAPGVFYNFSASGSPFEVNAGYSPFAVYTMLKCNGDYSQAAGELAKRYELDKTTSYGAPTSGEMDHHLTDVGNSEYIRDLYGEILRFDLARGRWLVWGGHRWKPIKEVVLNKYAAEAARHRYEEAKKIDNLTQRQIVARWAIASEKRSALVSAMEILKSLPPVSDEGENWDLDPMLFSCPNGILDLRTGEFRDGQKEDHITMVSGVNYDQSAQCPRWEQFINEIFLNDAELIHFMKKALGYSLTGDVSEQVLFFCYGKGRNGKSVLFETLQSLLKDYGHSAPATLFQRNVASSASNDARAIDGKRFVVGAETLSSTKVNEQRLKKWSGGDTETARFLFHENVSFKPVCKIYLYLNHRPVVEDDSDGFWRRVRLIPFNATFKGRNEDKGLVQKLTAELPGILNWLFEGCRLWQAEGLQAVPAAVTEATKAYEFENDSLAEFINEKFGDEKMVEMKSTELYRAYREWANAHEIKDREQLSMTKFGTKMTDRFTKKKTPMGMVYVLNDQNPAGLDEKFVPTAGLAPHFPIPSYNQSFAYSNGKTTPNPATLQESTKEEMGSNPPVTSPGVYENEESSDEPDFGEEIK